ncbi:lectin subunit alpha-like [Sitodiplosis mosellana]|uniref:lectin subunit alpha-like n=1 Tax=Sitodiplosis mosellana TaxID=263140 RepID=UPI002444E2E2|nr:lectin subunit alpha-like [Sitodiplosis mosellana]
MLRLLILLFGCIFALSQNCTDNGFQEYNGQREKTDKYYRDDGTMPMVNGFYFNKYDNYNWHEAAEFCMYHGMQLVTFNTRYEECLFEKAIAKLGWTGRDINFWIGGTNSGNFDNKNYMWMSNGEPFKYTHWGQNQPDNNGGNEHCVEWVNYNKNWNDRDCNKHIWSVCEKRCMPGGQPDKECLGPGYQT